MKILNLYAGIGGNRALWGSEHKITAVEYNKNIAKIYSDNFPDDEVIVADAHEFLLEHFNEFDIIWASPPCPTHSRARYWGYKLKNPTYPDMRLYQEIILLKYHATNEWVIENVIPYYEPLIKPTVKLGRHIFWSNVFIPPHKFNIKFDKDNIASMMQEYKQYGIKITDVRGIDVKTVLRNCVHPLIGKYILDVLLGKKIARIDDFTP